MVPLSDLEPTEEVVMNRGTTITLENLFFRNQVKAQAATHRKCLGDLELLVKQFGCHFVDCLFDLKIGGKNAYKSQKGQSKEQNILHAFPELARHGLYHTAKTLDRFLEFQAYFSRPNDPVPHKTVLLFVNNRLSKNKELLKALTNAYKIACLSINAKGENFFVYLEIKVSLKYVDFNRSADKYEIKIADEGTLIQEIEGQLLTEIRSKMNVKTYSTKIEKFNSFTRESLYRETGERQEPREDSRFQMRANPGKVVLENFFRSGASNRFSGATATILGQEELREGYRSGKEPGGEAPTEGAGGPDDAKLCQEFFGENKGPSHPKKVGDGATLRVFEGDQEQERALAFDLTQPETSEILSGVEFLGAVDPFQILIQKDYSLLHFQTTHFLHRYLEFEVKKVAMNPSTPTFLQILKVKDFVFEPQKFEKLTEKRDLNPKVATERMWENLKTLNQVLPAIFSAGAELSTLKILVPPFLSGLCDGEAVHFFLFRVALLPKTLAVLNFPDALAKLYLWLLREAARDFSDAFKRNMDLFYERVFFDLKRHVFGYSCTPYDDIHDILDIKNSYKLFERC